MFRGVHACACTRVCVCMSVCLCLLPVSDGMNKRGRESGGERMRGKSGSFSRELKWGERVERHKGNTWEVCSYTMYFPPLFPPTI